MAFNGSGTFVRLYNWVTDLSNSIPVTASRMDAEQDGIATALSNCVLKDGTQTITANIPMSSKKFTGLTNGSARTDSIALGQVQDNTYEYLGENGGVADAYTWTPSPAVAAYAAGQSWIIKIGAGDGNTTASTGAISGLATPRAIEKSDGAGATTALESGDMIAGGVYKLVDNGALLILQNPEKPYIDWTNIKADASATVAGIVELLTDAELATGTDTTRAATAANILSLFAASSQAAAGYARLPINISGAFDEIIIQWGVTSGNVPAGGTLTEAMGLTFPTAILIAVNTSTASASAGAQGIGLTTMTTSQLTHVGHGNTASPAKWIAIGY